MINEGNTVLSQQWRDFYNRIISVLLDLNDRQFIVAWQLWRQRRNEKQSGQTRATALLKRMR